MESEEFLKLFESNFDEIRPHLEKFHKEMLWRPRIIGDPSRIHVGESSYVNNALLNVNSGNIKVRKNSFFGADVALITCTHDSDAILDERRHYPSEGRDICIGEGVWIASRAVILGPCIIGDYAVVAAGAVVRSDVPAYTLVGGIPATIIRMLAGKENSDKTQ